MDIQHLVDRLEDLIDEGRHLPMSKFTVIDEERALEIIDQMRISIPEQIEKATRIVNQRDRLIAQANEEATRMLDLSRQKADELVQRDAIVQTAQHRAENIMLQARQEAAAIRDEADSYVMDVLKELESHLLRTLTIVRNGVTKIAQDRDIRAQAAAQAQVVQSAPPPPVVPMQTPVPTSKAVKVEKQEFVDAGGSD